MTCLMEETIGRLYVVQRKGSTCRQDADAVFGMDTRGMSTIDDEIGAVDDPRTNIPSLADIPYQHRHGERGHRT